MTAPQVIARPGKMGGPCKQTRCNSEVCERFRRDAEAPCSICGEPIGFDTRYLSEPADDGEFAPEVFTHEICAAAQEIRSPTT